MIHRKSDGTTITVPLDGVSHTLILGFSGQGKSRLREVLEVEARKRGITVEELERQMQPSPEQIEAARQREEQIEALEAQRLAAVCEAYWLNTPADSSCLQQLRDTLIVAEIAVDPSPAQVKALLLSLPAHIVGQGIAWDFSDTDVRAHLYEYVEENMAAITAAVSEAGQQ